MASKEAKSDAPEAAAAPAAPSFAFEFKLLKDKIGEKTTNKQVKAKVNEAFLGYGAFDECRVVGDAGADRTVTVFFARLFGKGQPAWDSLSKGEAVTVSLYDETIALSKSDSRPSGGGATTGTSSRPKKEAAKGEGKRGGRGRGRPEGKDGKEGEGKGEGKEGKKDGKDGDKKDGGRGRGRGKQEEKGPSLQRGRANIGGKLGQMSKVRLAKIEREKKIKEAKERGEPIDEKTGKPLGGAEEKEEKKEDAKPAAGKKEAGKKEAGKAEAGKKGDAGKKEGGKKEAGKAEGGKKEAAKAPAKGKGK